MCKNTEKKYRDVWEDHLVYLAYLPYSMTLIVLFEDFTAQLHTRLPHRTIGSKDLRCSRLTFFVSVSRFSVLNTRHGAKKCASK